MTDPLVVVARLMLSPFFDKRFLEPVATRAQLRPFVKALWFQRLLRFNASCPWPLAPTSRISNYTRIHFPSDEIHNFQSPGCYFQNFAADIHLSRGVFIGPNVGIITANHKRDDLAAHEPGRDVRIGEGCWVGMNSVLLPGVQLGPRTVVAAGSVVTRSFPSGNAIVGGVPARVLRELT